MKNILVTGGAGYIGSHASKLLAHVGYAPVAYDNLVYGHRWAVKWGPLVEGDLLDRVLLEKTIQKYRISAVLHFASWAYVGESMVNPGKYFMNNVAGTINLLEAMLACNVKQIVFSSSCATYGIPETLPIVEETIQRPVNPYGESKLMVERMLRWYEQIYGLRHVTLRYFNACGADLDGEIGECHDPETHLIPLVIAAALDQRSSVQILGNDYDTPDGTCIRDYIHVGDLADAHVKALEFMECAEASETFNLGTGSGHSVMEIVRGVEKISGNRVPYDISSRRLGDPPILVANAEKANRVLGWKPRWSELDNIITSAWNWQSSRLQNYAPSINS